MGVVLALQALDAVHVGVENLSVVGHVGLLPDGLKVLRLVELEKTMVTSWHLCGR